MSRRRQLSAGLLIPATVVLLASCLTTEHDPNADDGNRATMVHAFGEIELSAAPSEDSEILPCVSWTLDNEESLYVQSVTLSNMGYFHHSNWFVVPEGLYPGDDGYWDCSTRGFTELDAATQGTVLFAQSTQSWVEEQRTRDGAVIKIPPRHKVVAQVHLLNTAPRVVSSELFMSLEIVHPKLVETILAPFRLTYYDLRIPPNGESHWSGSCDVSERYEEQTGKPFDMKLHYVLPHYHYLGNYFSVKVKGGDLDGEELYGLEGFNGEANGKVFDPPIDLSGSTGFDFTCGYQNWRDEQVGWGVGDQEMCVMLGLAESDALFDASVSSGTQAVGEQNGVIEYEGYCSVFVIPKHPNQSDPTQEEIDGELYIPPGDPGDEGVLPIPECDVPDLEVEPSLAPTLSNVRDAVLIPSCAYNSCHGRAGAIAGLNVESEVLHDELLNHEVQGDPNLPLIEPGNPEESYLYRLISECEPTNSEGEARRAMPLNSPVLLDDEAIALVREWIEAGAPND